MHYIHLNFKRTFLFTISLAISVIAMGQSITDASIKKNISAIDSPLQKLVQLSPKSYEYDYANFKHLKLEQGRQYGFIAEDIQAIFPSLVKEKSVSYMFGKNAYRNTRIKVIDEASLIPVLVASIQEQQLEIEKLKTEMQELKTRLAGNKN